MNTVQDEDGVREMKRWKEEVMRLMVKTIPCALAAILFTGCAGLETYRIATGPEPFHRYDLPIYATESVPFEYEELGIVRGVAWAKWAWPDQTKCVEAMVKEAKALGADAVIGVSVTSSVWSDGFVLVIGNGILEVQGVAVKVKRP